MGDSSVLTADHKNPESKIQQEICRFSKGRPPGTLTDEQSKSNNNLQSLDNRDWTTGEVFRMEKYPYVTQVESGRKRRSPFSQMYNSNGRKRVLIGVIIVVLVVVATTVAVVITLRVKPKETLDVSGKSDKTTVGTTAPSAGKSSAKSSTEAMSSTKSSTEAMSSATTSTEAMSSATTSTEATSSVKSPTEAMSSAKSPTEAMSSATTSTEAMSSAKSPTEATSSAESSTYTTSSESSTRASTTTPPSSVSSAIQPCPQGDFLCGDGKTCMPIPARCDSRVNCTDGSDERGCVEADGSAISVFSYGGMKPLCANGSTTPELNNKVGEAVCMYTGYEKLKIACFNNSAVVDNGTMLFPDPSSSHFLGQFRAVKVSECSPLHVECANEVTNCGHSVVSLASNYIQYGRDALRGQWPWVVHLKRRGEIVCGGSLIDRQWVLSAYHCLRGNPMSDFTVVLGSHRRSVREDSEREYNVTRMVKHENYTYENGRSVNDVVLLFLIEPVTFSDYIQPVCLPTRSPRKDDLCYIIGWGRLVRARAGYSDVLQQVRVDVYSGEKCDPFYPDDDIYESNVCARTRLIDTGYTPSCYGDSGGPMLCLNGVGRWEIHGVVSFGPPNCYSSSAGYSVLSNVFSFKHWIQNATDASLTRDERKV